VSRPGFTYNPEFEFEYKDFTTAKTSEDDYTPMASVQYLIDDLGWLDAGTFYLTYSEGFLSGGVSEAPGGILDTFEPEEVENWELGFKLDLLDRRLRMNGAFFHSDYKNRQLTSIVIDPVLNSVAPDTTNAAESTIQGFELETTWLATDKLMLTFNMTLNDGDIDEFIDQQVTLADPDTPEVPAGCVRTSLVLIEVDQCPNDRSGENLPRLPEQTYLLAAQYAWESPIGLVMPRMQASWKLDMEFCLDSVSCDTGRWFEDEQFDLSATITWTSTDEKWLGTLYGTNLTDEDYLNGGIALVESSGVGGIAVAPPRMYGLELEYRF
jgi:iron complex outermembrane receptor protein